MQSGDLLKVEENVSHIAFVSKFVQGSLKSLNFQPLAPF